MTDGPGYITGGFQKRKAMKDDAKLTIGGAGPVFPENTAERGPGKHEHKHGGGGDHGSHGTTGPRLLTALVLNLIIPAAQVVGGLQAHSVALLSDAAHNFSDFAALLIAYVANRISRRGASLQNTFGYKRVEIMAAIINVMTLLGAAAFITYEAVLRLLHPEPVSGGLVVILACVGILGNGISAWMLHRDSEHNLNVKSAFIHLVGDLLTSVAVLVSGIILIYEPWYWLDPVLSALISILIVKTCWQILKEATCILMDATPRGLDIQSVKDSLEGIPGVRGVHYLHAWNVCSSSVAFSCHFVVPDQQLSKIDELAGKARELLFSRFGIDHPILQFETEQCGEGGLFCGMSCGNKESGSKCGC